MLGAGAGCVGDVLMLLVLQVLLLLLLLLVLLLLFTIGAFAAAKGGAISGLQCANGNLGKNLRLAFRLGRYGVFLKKHVRFQGCAVPKLDCSHMVVGTSMSIYSHPWLLRLPFFACKSAAFFFGLAVFVFLFASVQRWEGG